MGHPRPGPRAWILLLPLLLAVALAFAPSLSGGFIWDDRFLIENNTYIKDFKFLKRNLVESFWTLPELSGGAEAEQSRGANLYYRPLVTLSYMVDHALWKGDPGGFHLTNLLLHGLVLLLFLLLLRRILPGRPAAWLVALAVMALHPSRAEAVSWIAGRTDVMMTAALLASLLGFWSYLTRREGRRWPFLLGGVAGYLAALACKETAVALVVLLPAMDLLLVQTAPGTAKVPGPRRWRLRAPLLHLALTLGSAGFVIWRILLQRSALGPDVNAGLSLLERLKLPLVTTGYNLKLTLLPYWPSGLVGADHLVAEPHWGLALAGLLAIAGWGAALWLSWRRGNGVLAWGLLVLGAGLAPTSNLVPLSILTLTAERFLYLPLLGLSLVVGWGAARLFARGGATTLATAAVLALLLGSWALSVHQRAGEYASSETFWRAELRQHPESPLARRELAEALMRQGSYRLAETEFLRAMAARTAALGESTPRMSEVSRLLEAHFLHSSREADLAELRRLLAFVRLLAPLDGEPTAAEARLRLHGHTLRLAPATARSRKALARHRALLLAMQGNIHSLLGDDRKALALLRRAVTLAPGHLVLQMNLTQALLRAGRLQQAAQRFEAVRDRAPGHPLVRRLGAALGEAAPIVQRLRAVPAGDTLTAGWLRAELYRVTGATPRLLAQLQRLVQEHPDQRRAWALLIQLQHGLGHTARARALLRRARARFGDEPGLLKLQRRLEVNAERPPSTP